MSTGLLLAAYYIPRGIFVPKKARVGGDRDAAGMALAPLRCLHNRGNTCWAASVLQALRALHRFVKSCDKNSLLGMAVGEPELREEMVAPLFTWCRACLKNEEGSGFRQADPSELLMELFDRKDVNTACFENKRTTYYKCLTCNHERRVNSKEKLLIVTTLPSGRCPVQRAVDLEFGYLEAKQSPFVEGKAVVPASEPPPLALGPQAMPSSTVPAYPPAPPASMSEYNRGFAGPGGQAVSASEARDASEAREASEASAAVGAPQGESWWRCDDGAVQSVRLTTATPYVLFYQERDGFVEMGEFEMNSTADEAARVHQQLTQRQDLDCDDGACQGSRQPHSTCVETYGIGEVLAIQVVFPKRMHMANVERTLLTRSSESSDDPKDQTGLKAYDLVSFVSRVGGAHYVAYRIKNRA